MNPMSLIVICVVVWVILIFIALPIGIKMPDKVQLGNADSAPEKHYVGLKLFITLICAIIATAVFWFCAEYFTI
jgi:predicted secreted protein